MKTAKKTSGSAKGPKPDSGRRSFIWKTGAAMSAVVASSVAGFSKPGLDPTGILEDANAVRTLHRTYEARLHEGLYKEVLDLFDDRAEVVYKGGLFSGRDKGIHRLFCHCFSAGLTGRKIEPAPGFGIDPAETVEVSLDRKSATGRFPYSIQVGKPMEEGSSLVAMARLQGEGIVKWWEGGICAASYVRVGQDWKIKRLEYRASAKADYRPGRASAKPIDVPAFAKSYPEDPMGPDRLV